MNVIRTLCSNKILVAAVLGWFIAQALKVIFVLIKDRHFDLRRMIGSGGMPSSHSAFVMAMATSTAYECGVASPIFAVSVVVAFVVMYDASGVRRETGRQAEILNDIIENIGKDTPAVMGKRLKELIGHTPFEVAVGAVLGLLIAIVIYTFFA